ncbi:MarR family winged helix-turn-helix transcriptional regulator [Stigmatella sp. ncwal1]|uniref:MarR family winged helix-turn-helix transcriptional regulator n=1 Tax=Stigmatella ashevillensis TaxID=2995309 RepID=A0ABT5DCB9_9BACT|nr:MarR family winged helix-turn-helix transcriptional regulator [Stigmatella ashevillena]MDC0710448.1 MarR family winged helix-turn-helix transcriptional regulator [Stigmatella ashevillena]
MRKASRRLTQLYDDALEQSGLRSTQFAILAELVTFAEPPSMAELAEALVTDRSALGHNLRPLEREGLIELREGTGDRRKRQVVMTARGRALFTKALPLWQAAQTRFQEVFGEAEAAQLRLTLLRIAYNERLGLLKD